MKPCPLCKAEITYQVPTKAEHTGKTHCTSCDRHLLVSAKDHLYPLSMMGYQSCDSDFYMKYIHVPKPPIWCKTKTIGKFKLSLYKTKFVLSRRGYAGRDIMWYPFRFGWAKGEWGPKLHLHVADRNKRFVFKKPDKPYL